MVLLLVALHALRAVHVVVAVLVVRLAAAAAVVAVVAALAEERLLGVGLGNDRVRGREGALEELDLGGVDLLGERELNLEV